MKRALRVDKMTLAALEAVLQLYANPDAPARGLPTLQLLTRAAARDRGSRRSACCRTSQRALGDKRADARVVACASQIGSGSLPVDSLPSAGIAVDAARQDAEARAAQRIAAAFRALPVPVIGRIRDGAFMHRPALPRRRSRLHRATAQLSLRLAMRRALRLR